MWRSATSWRLALPFASFGTSATKCRLDVLKACGGRDKLAFRAVQNEFWDERYKLALRYAKSDFWRAGDAHFGNF